MTNHAKKYVLFRYPTLQGRALSQSCIHHDALASYAGILLHFDETNAGGIEYHVVVGGNHRDGSECLAQLVFVHRSAYEEICVNRW